MRALDHALMMMGLVFVFFPVLLSQSHLAVLNHIVDWPMIALMNVILLIYFLESEIRRFRYQSIFLLVVAAIAVFSSFLRIIPLPAGISLAFHLPICAGLIFGPLFGFMIGQLSMLVGGIFLGAFGPWLPYQALLMGCIGYYAGYIPKKVGNRTVLITVIGYSFLVSFIYGYWMSVDTWRLAMMDAVLPDRWWDRIVSYTQFYVITSLFWDFTRAIGNVIVIGIFLRPTCELFERAKAKLTYYK